MTALLFIIAALTILDGLMGIYMIGKQRPTVTPGYATLNILISAFVTVVLVTAALHY